MGTGESHMAEMADLSIDDMVQIHSLKSEEYMNKRGRIVAEKNENQRYAVIIEDRKFGKTLLVKHENLRKLAAEYHYGFWGCQGCGAQCDCGEDEFHANDCNHSMNCLRRKGPLCHPNIKCFWVGCCLSTKRDGPCLAIDRNTRQIPTYPFPEREWVTSADGVRSLQAKAWPYL